MTAAIGPAKSQFRLANQLTYAPPDPEESVPVIAFCKFKPFEWLPDAPAVIASITMCLHQGLYFLDHW